MENQAVGSEVYLVSEFPQLCLEPQQSSLILAELENKERLASYCLGSQMGLSSSLKLSPDQPFWAGIYVH